MANGLIIALEGTSAFTPAIAVELEKRFRAMFNEEFRNKPELRQIIQKVTIEAVM